MQTFFAQIRFRNSRFDMLAHVIHACFASTDKPSSCSCHLDAACADCILATIESRSPCNFLISIARPTKIPWPSRRPHALPPSRPLDPDFQRQLIFF